MPVCARGHSVARLLRSRSDLRFPRRSLTFPLDTEARHVRTDFDLCDEAQPLRNALWLSRGTPEFWKLLKECDSRVRLQPPGTKEQIEKLRGFAGGSLPESLEDFLHCSNGLFFDFDEIVFPTDLAIRETLRMREMGTGIPVDLGHMLFIGATGDGDMFAFARSKSGVWLGDVYQWDHETESLFSCGLGIYGYVAGHVSWWHSVKPE